MARLRHTTSGAIISVADEKVDRMGSEWEPAKAPVKKTAAKKAAAKKSSSKK